MENAMKMTIRFVWVHEKLPTVSVPKRGCWKTEQTFGNVFSNHFSKTRSPKTSTHPFEKWFENTCPNVRSVFQHLRLGAHTMLCRDADCTERFGRDTVVCYGCCLYAAYEAHRPGRVGNEVKVVQR